MYHEPQYKIRASKMNPRKVFRTQLHWLWTCPNEKKPKFMKIYATNIKYILIYGQTRDSWGKDDNKQGSLKMLTYDMIYLKCLHVKSEGVWYLSLQEKHLMMGWSGNLDSSMVKSARLVIWRSVVQIPVQVQIFLLKTKL